ncbi:hypothetical protein BpHYR1_002540 [Brachionus plicatilis]|uniref:Uncharacterized protein n=1 Tax=Brachionus plicatilis TaxID=10195 RepID=A0A3M7R785_BRAPC|nr:hypothetical protein BpHYR1_002540 [Brachionus plicatilis]
MTGAACLGRERLGKEMIQCPLKKSYILALAKCDRRSYVSCQKFRKQIQLLKT